MGDFLGDQHPRGVSLVDQLRDLGRGDGGTEGGREGGRDGMEGGREGGREGGKTLLSATIANKNDYKKSTVLPIFGQAHHKTAKQSLSFPLCSIKTIMSA